MKLFFVLQSFCIVFGHFFKTGQLFQDRNTQRKELSAVMYDTNVLGFKGPRRMTVVLPGMNAEGRRVDFRSMSDHDGLIERYKSKNMVSRYFYLWTKHVKLLFTLCTLYLYDVGIRSMRFRYMLFERIVDTVKGMRYEWLKYNWYFWQRSISCR